MVSLLLLNHEASWRGSRGFCPFRPHRHRRDCHLLFVHHCYYWQGGWVAERAGSWGAWLGSNWDPQFATGGALGKSLLTSDLLISKVRASVAAWLGCWEGSGDSICVKHFALYLAQVVNWLSAYRITNQPTHQMPSGLAWLQAPHADYGTGTPLQQCLGQVHGERGQPHSLGPPWCQALGCRRGSHISSPPQPWEMGITIFLLSFPGGAVVKNPPANAGGTRDVGSIPGSGSSSGEGNGNPLWYSCLGNSMDRGAW